MIIYAITRGRSHSLCLSWDCSLFSYIAYSHRCHPKSSFIFFKWSRPFAVPCSSIESAIALFCWNVGEISSIISHMHLFCIICFVFRFINWRWKIGWDYLEIMAYFQSFSFDELFNVKHVYGFELPNLVKLFVRSHLYLLIFVCFVFVS